MKVYLVIYSYDYGPTDILEAHTSRDHANIRAITLGNSEIKSYQQKENGINIKINENGTVFVGDGYQWYESIEMELQ